MTKLRFDGLVAEAYDRRAGGTSKTLSRVAVMGVGAAVMVGWFSMSAKFVDVDTLKSEVLHVRAQEPEARSVPVSIISEAHADTRPDAGVEALKAELAAMHPVLPERTDVSHTTAPERRSRVEAAADSVAEQPHALSQQAFSLRFQTDDAAVAVHVERPAESIAVLASLQPSADRFGGATPMMDDSPLKAALDARRAAREALVAPTLEASLDPETFILPDVVPLPTGRPRTAVAAVAKAVPEKPVQETVAAVAPAAKPSSALLAVVESLPSVSSLIARAKPRQADKPKQTEQAKQTEKPKQKTKTVEIVRAPKKKSKASVLAYATPDLEDKKSGNGGGLLSNLFGDNPKKAITTGRRSGVAIYDISTATVHMPNGEKLEAHSGLGHMKDNPKYVDRRMNGPTPPNVYNLRMREARYHGVEAIRMLPTDHKRMHGRNGILAHTSLVRGTNGSHGCVAFKDYDKFLKAFKRGEVKKLVVVPRMSEAKVYLASL